jgi:glycerol-3-phosphate dehydrogenase
MMAGKLGLGPSTLLDKEETLNYIPNVNKKGLRGGVIYHDGQFDDARMAISLMLTANQEGATLLNYADVLSLTKEKDIINGLKFRDQLSGNQIHINAKVVVNATGVFSDRLIALDQP